MAIWALRPLKLYAQRVADNLHGPHFKGVDSNAGCVRPLVAMPFADAFWNFQLSQIFEVHRLKAASRHVHPVLEKIQSRIGSGRIGGVAYRGTVLNGWSWYAPEYTAGREKKPNGQGEDKESQLTHMLTSSLKACDR